jgi:hypothetical protein
VARPARDGWQLQRGGGGCGRLRLRRRRGGSSRG